MKTILILIALTLVSLQSINSFGQNAVIYGKVLLVTQLDTISMSRATIKLYKVLDANVEEHVNDYFSGSDGIFYISNVQSGTYFFRVYYGSTGPYLFHPNNSNSTNSSKFEVSSGTINNTLYIWSPK